MKKLSFILLFLLTSKIWGQDVRQARKGDFLVGGSFSGYYENNQGFEFDHNYSLSLSSNACYFVLNKFATGLSVSVTQEWTRISNDAVWNKNSFNKLSPLLRYYAWKNLFISFEPGYIFGNYTISSMNIKTTGFNLYQGLGYDFFIKENIALEIGYFYSYSMLHLKSVYENKYPFPSDLKNQKSLINFGIQIFI